MDLNKQKDETTLQYIWRLGSAKDSGTLDMTWDELAEVFNENLGQDYGSSAYRKPFGQAKAYYDEVFSKMESEDYNHELMMQRRKLEQLKVQYRDNRNAWNKQNYIEARIDQKLDYLEEQLQDIGRIEFPDHEIIRTNSNNDLIVFLTDLHIGETFDSKFGVYNSDIAKERLDKYISEIINIGNLHNIENVYVFLGGDQISGNIHKSIQVSNRENVIDQVKLASEYIAAFVYELSLKFKNINVASVAGNHSRMISQKELDIREERLDDLISWIVKQMTSNVKNINFIEDNYDNGIAKATVRGLNYIMVHGDFDAPNANAINRLCTMIGEFPYAVLAGHRHTPMSAEFNGIKYIQSGALAEAGDSYTVSKRLKGKACQTVLVCNSNGIQCTYNVELS